MAKKRFSPKELAEWIYKTASEAITDEDMAVVYYKLVGGGLAVVLAWSSSSDYQYEKDKPIHAKRSFQRFRKCSL